MRNRLYRIIAIPFIVLLFIILALVGMRHTLVEPVQALGATIYVDDDTCPAVGSGTLAAPYCSIQVAVDAASAGDEIRVAVGTYVGAETVGRALWGGNTYTYTQVVFIDKELTLTGGYEPGDWDTSDPANNRTIIDAEGRGRAISVVAPGGPVCVDGFTITGGDYTGFGNQAGAGNSVCGAGEGIDCGGGIYARNGVLLLRNSLVTGNVASRVNGRGGGVYLWEMYSGTRVEESAVIGNSALGSYGGGGMYGDGIRGPMVIVGSTFQDNYATGAGGGMLLYDVDALVTIEETDFRNNTAATTEGGGAHIRPTEEGETLRMDRVCFQDNQAHERAAALYIHAAGNVIPHATLTNMVFGGNSVTATRASDAVVAIEGRFTSLGVDLAHVTAADNQAPTFLYAEPGSDPEDLLTVGLSNTLLVSFTHAFAGREWTDGDVLIRHVNTLADDVTMLHETVAGSPTFEAVNTLSGDPKLDVDHRLLSGSAAIDGGVEAGLTTDIDGDYRPQGVAPDIGADEYVFGQAPATVTISGPSQVSAQDDIVYAAEVSPVMAMLPMTYVWEATGLPSVTHVTGALNDAVSFKWPTPGAKTVTVTATNAEGSASDTFAVDVTAEPVLHISKSAPAEAIVGEPITYTLTITNAGVADAEDLAVVDTLPDGASYVSGGMRVGTEIQWSISSLAANGGVAQVSFVVLATETITNITYGVSAMGGYSASGEVPVVTVVGRPALSIAKTGPYAVAVGERIEYALTVTNDGTIAAEELVISDVLPIGATYVNGGALVGDEIRWELDSVPGHGGQATVDFSVTAEQTILNESYGVTARGGFGAVGESPVQTVVGTGTRYVAPGGVDGPNNCTERSSPCATLQHAVDVAQAGEEVRVAEGTYTGATTVGIEQWDGDVYSYTQVVFINKGITLRGGYESGNWETSDPADNLTIIDAQGHGRGISVVSPVGPVTVDGFTITGGDYSGLGNPPGSGYEVCRAGGGIDCGGGVYALSGVLVLRNSAVTGNVASQNEGLGGGIYLLDVRDGTRIENTTVSSNSALGSYGNGGGMYADRVNGPMTIIRSTFEDNYAGGAGGGLLVYDAERLVAIEETRFVDNTAAAYEGGGAHIRVTEGGDILHMDRVRFEDNQAHQRAAALYIHAADNVIPHATLTNVVFGGNSVTVTRASDAVIAIEGRFTSLDVDLAHVTAADNRAPTFLYAEPAWDEDDRVTVTLTNTLAAAFTYGFAAEEVSSGDVLIRHVNTLVDDVTTLHETVAGSPTFEAVNTLSGDPKLDVDHRLLSGSAAIDAGVDAGVTMDIDGQARPYGDHVDIGADEFIPLAAESVSILGPTTGLVGQSYTFEAVVDPPAAVGPLTYDWSPEPAAGEGSPKAVYMWTTEGVKSLAVTVTGPLGTTPPGSHEITVDLLPVYLPLVLRQ